MVLALIPEENVIVSVASALFEKQRTRVRGIDKSVPLRRL
jgi:hypothetical protein